MADVMRNEEFVVPVFSSRRLDTFVGTAFCVDGYLVTAGHVVPEFKIYYIGDGEGKFIELSPYERICRCPGKEIFGEDIAVYHLPLRSGLVLSGESPAVSSAVEVICWQQADAGGVRRITSSGYVMGAADEDNGFYRILPRERLLPGASGSPVVQGNKVVGMLTVGVLESRVDSAALMAERLSADDVKLLTQINDNMRYILRPKVIMDVIKNYPDSKRR